MASKITRLLGLPLYLQAYCSAIVQIMKIKSFLARPFASYIYKGIRKNMAAAIADQESILKTLIRTGRNTEIGKEYNLDSVNAYEEFKQAVPIRDYEQLQPYI